MAEEKRWPEVVLSRVPKSDRLRFAPSSPAPGFEAAAEFLTETYVPAEKLEQEREKRRELESKLESGYLLCHPEDDCDGKRAWLKASTKLEQVERERDEAEVEAAAEEVTAQSLSRKLSIAQAAYAQVRERLEEQIRHKQEAVAGYPRGSLGREAAAGALATLKHLRDLLADLPDSPPTEQDNRYILYRERGYQGWQVADENFQPDSNTLELIEAVQVAPPACDGTGKKPTEQGEGER